MNRRKFAIGLAQCGGLFVWELFAVTNGWAQEGRRSKGQKQKTQNSSERKVWVTFHSPERDYNVQFPTRPRVNDDSNAERSTSRVAEALNHRFFIQAYLGDPSETVWTRYAIDHFVQRMRSDGFIIHDLRIVAPNIFEVRTENQRGNNSRISKIGMSRTILRDGLVYVMGVNPFPGAPLDYSIAQKFFSSIKFTSGGRKGPGDAEGRVIACRRCNGAGKEFCVPCRGTGWTDPALQEVEGRKCKFCYGEGRYTCNTCGGKGKVRI